MLKTPVQLPVFHHTDGDQSNNILKELGLPTNDSPESYDVKPVWFYSINAISEYSEEEFVGSAIHANGSEYLTPMTVKQVQEEIAKSNV